MNLHSKISTAFLFLFLLSISAQKVFVEENSRVIVEMESGTTTGWQLGTTTVGASNIQYIYGINEYLSSPGNFKLVYKIRINNKGTYRFVWHSKVGNGTSSTEHNDSWLRIVDASLFFAYKDGVTLRPKGFCINDCPEGAGKEGWFKTYSHGTTNWTWNTATNDKNPFSIYARFDNPGIYTVEVSMRSNYQYLDRFVLFNEAVNTLASSTNLALPESTIESPNALQKIREPQYLYRLDPTKKKLTSQTENEWILFNSNGIRIGNGIGKEVNISMLKSGFYVIKTNNGIQKVII